MNKDTPRLVAKAAGLKRYEGLPCINCGGTTRLVNCQRCVVCKQKKKYESRKRNQKYGVKGRPKTKVPWDELSEEEKEKVREKRREQRKEFWKKNPDKRKAKRAKFRANQLLRMPKWLSKEDLRKIKDIYKHAADKEAETGTKWHVDHIIPLNGKLVSGLHVPENLQVIPKEQNIKKSNKYQVE